MNILVPTDFSENAMDALRYATGILAERGGKLFLVSAYEVPTVSRGSTAALRRKIEENLQAKADALKNTLNNMDSALEFEIFLREEDTLGLIRRAVEHFNIDLVVMGTKGSSGMEEVFIGSVTASVVGNVDAPVLAVPSHVRYNGFGLVTVSTDLAEDAFDLAKNFMDWFKPFEGKVEFLHIARESDEAEAGGKMKSLRGRLTEAGYAGFATVMRPNDSIREGIVGYLESVNPSLFVMITRKRGLIGKLFDPSLTKKMAMHLQVPLLAIQHG